MEVYYDPDEQQEQFDRQAINIAYIAPSVTPFSNFNPGFIMWMVITLVQHEW